LLYEPASKQEKVLAKPPPPEFVAKLRQRGVAPLSAGRVIVATWRPHEAAVLKTIVDLGLELQVVFNKDAVMVLPSGVNKSTGLAAALAELELSPHEAVGVGDAENDHAFLSLCECAVAVANALPSVKKEADLVTRGDHGAGVVELIDQLCANDLTSLEDELHRHRLLFGHDEKGAEVWFKPYGYNLLIAGPSGSGKSTAATGFLERLAEHHYQFCIIDPEGDYENLAGAVTLGNSKHGPTVEEILQVLASAGKNVVVNLIGLALADRPPFFVKLLPRLVELRARTGHPHWLVVDEAHHLLPASWVPGPNVLPQDLERTVFITVHPDQVARAALASVAEVVAVGKAPGETVAAFCAAVAEPPPASSPQTLAAGEVLLWSRARGTARGVRLVPNEAEHQRHVRKYAEGELPPERSFYFRGPEGKLNLRAQNLILFMQLADGVDDATWRYHLDNGDYAHWFRTRVKDPALADATAALQKRRDLSPRESRAQLRALIEKAYTLPAR
ncbi:MAG TPA: HAD hydrolase family protein, partial [Pirellulales bacterium]|nr:HAD hydrolase family protein [Pirellulales bacterium]